MGDEQVGQVELLLQVLQQIDHLGLDGHIQGRDGFITDDQGRLQGQGARHADALALAAGEFVRIAAGKGRVQLDQVQQVLDPFSWISLPLATPCTARGSPMISPTVMRGFRLA